MNRGGSVGVIRGALGECATGRAEPREIAHVRFQTDMKTVCVIDR